MIGGFFARRRGHDHVATALYHAIVAQARQVPLYRDFGVPDTVEGRFEMVLLHIVVLFRRLQSEGQAGQDLAQQVFDNFVTDMDRSLREMGVGDLGVPKRMKAVGRSFYGRLEAYGRPLAESDRTGLARALQRNLFPDEAPEPVATEGLAAYALSAAADVARQDFAAIAGGTLQFPAVSDTAPHAVPM